MEKLYFENVDATFCQSKDTFISQAKHEGLEKITLIEAIKDTDKDYVWCCYEGEAVDRSDCRKSDCDNYSSKSGRGVCKHRGQLYHHGEKFEFKVK